MFAAKSPPILAFAGPSVVVLDCRLSEALPPLRADFGSRAEPRDENERHFVCANRRLMAERRVYRPPSAPWQEAPSEPCIRSRSETGSGSVRLA